MSDDVCVCAIFHRANGVPGLGWEHTSDETPEHPPMPACVTKLGETTWLDLRGKECSGRRAQMKDACMWAPTATHGADKP